MVNTKEDSYRLFEFDSRVGLNASHTHHSFPCLFNEETKVFYVMLGSATVDKFTKSTFMNLASFAEKSGAKQIVLVQKREHEQKDQFRKLFKVMDAKRVGKKAMKESLTEKRIREWIDAYALFQIDI